MGIIEPAGGCDDPRPVEASYFNMKKLNVPANATRNTTAYRIVDVVDLFMFATSRYVQR